MKREIKFRVWDIYNKQFLKLCTAGLYFIYNSEWLPITKFIGSESYVVQQFTGLKDKNGLEIYEGDIVKCLNDLNYEVKHGKYKHVDCPVELYGWFLSGINDNGWQWEINGYIKIIGNIFENPESLNNKKYEEKEFLWEKWRIFI